MLVSTVLGWIWAGIAVLVVTNGIPFRIGLTKAMCLAAFSVLTFSLLLKSLELDAERKRQMERNEEDG